MSKKSKIILIFTLSLTCVIFSGLFACVFLMNYDRSKPAEVRLIDVNGMVYAQAEINNEYYGYRFKFESQSGEVIINSASSRIALSQREDFVLGEEYKISVQYLGEMEGANTQFSNPVKWNAVYRLSAPEVTITDGLLQWNVVKKADYYEVYSGESAPRRVTDTSFNTTSIAGGPQTFFVVAKSGKAFIEASAASNSIEQTVTYHLSDFSDVSFDRTTSTLRVTYSREIQYIKVILMNGEYFVKANLASQSEGYVYTANIEPIISVNDITMYVMPADLDQYNIYVGMGVSVNLKS